MISELEDRIRQRAHKIWESEGRPSDRADIHWSLASAEISADAPQAPAAKARAPKAAAAAAPEVAKAERAPTAKAAPKSRAAKA